MWVCYYCLQRVEKRFLWWTHVNSTSNLHIVSPVMIP